MRTKALRMKELIRRTGLSPSTVHFYLQEGLIPPAEKPTRNSAIYTEAHVERLNLIRALRTEGGGMPLASVRRVLELVEQGIEPPVAIALHRAVLGGLADDEDARPQRYEEADIAEASGLGGDLLRELLDAGVILPSPGDELPFDGVDLRVARLIKDALGATPTTVEDLREIAGHLREVSAKEMELRNRAVKSLNAEGSAELSGRLQEMANLWHTYLFARLRQNLIAIHGLGVAEEPASRPKTETTSETTEEEAS